MTDAFAPSPNIPGRYRVDQDTVNRVLAMGQARALQMAQQNPDPEFREAVFRVYPQAAQTMGQRPEFMSGNAPNPNAPAFEGPNTPDLYPIMNMAEQGIRPDFSAGANRTGAVTPPIMPGLGGGPGPQPPPTSAPPVAPLSGAPNPNLPATNPMPMSGASIGGSPPVPNAPGIPQVGVPTPQIPQELLQQAILGRMQNGPPNGGGLAPGQENWPAISNQAYPLGHLQGEINLAGPLGMQGGESSPTGSLSGAGNTPPLTPGRISPPAPPGSLGGMLQQDMAGHGPGNPNPGSIQGMIMALLQRLGIGR